MNDKILSNTSQRKKNTAKKYESLVEKALSYLLSVLEAQHGYEEAKEVMPSSLGMPCDLCGIFGPYEVRNHPDVLALGAREINFYREFEPLLGGAMHETAEIF